VKGYLRSDGRKGIRNVVLVVYLVECAHFVAREIALNFRGRNVQVIGFTGCYPSDYAQRVFERLCTHPNVGAVLLVSLGCEGFDRYGLRDFIKASGRGVETVVIQKAGGTAGALAAGTAWIEATLPTLAATPTVSMTVSDLVVGTVCGGSDGTSGLTANPAIGKAFDRLVSDGAACLFGENAEMIGCETFMASRAVTPELGAEIVRAVGKAARSDHAFGYGSFAPGNAEGGLTTQEEKSLGAYAKSGSVPITGLLQPAMLPPRGGLYLIDDTSDGVPRHGFAQLNDSTKLAELAASGAHLILFSTGRGSVIGNAISPVLKICANPETFRRMEGDMDIDAGRILDGATSLEDVGDEIVAAVLETAAGRRTKSEALGHQEFVLTYKTYEPAGPACLPVGSA
jgi:altronate dehydratase large subunit